MSGPALYPGSFDPFTNGHLDIVDRALQLFDGLVVAVAANPEKRTPLFSPEERVAMIREALADRPTVEVTSYRGLTVEFARSRGIRVVVKGLRLPSDFEAELQQALMNRQLAPEIDTVFLISGLPQLFVSSSILKDVAGHGRDVGRFVPPVVARRLKERFS
ncbi:MAG TPA: pantetheine-phosphate adenylyltransferase [Candidatus Dormibacteraeota bacterium]|nr:pantetheine-phosphate adenylyltransferase [Candidatus Dormibacteraeota bacterium]